MYPEFWDRYNKQQVLNFTQEQREYFLIGMMKVNFLKRLESSVFSFAITMGRTVDKIKALEGRIRKFKELAEENDGDRPAALSPEDEDDEELRDALEVGKGLQYRMAHLDVNRWRRDLEKDRVQLEYLATKQPGNGSETPNWPNFEG